MLQTRTIILVTSALSVPIFKKIKLNKAADIITGGLKSYAVACTCKKTGFNPAEADLFLRSQIIVTQEAKNILARIFVRSKK